MKDGNYTYYTLKVENVDGKWTGTYLDSWELPGFGVDDPCYKQTGIRGTINEIEAINGANILRNKLNRKVQVVEITISKTTKPKTTLL